MLKSPARLRLILSLAALAAAVAVYLWIGTAQLALPGLQYDEAADAVPAIEMITGQPLTSISSITFLGREWPLMMLHHIGPSSIYLSFLGLSAFGISVEALRLTQLIIGASTLILLWLAAKSWFDDAVAALAVLLCATAPAFVWWSRAGLNWTLPLLPLALGILMALHRWWRTRRAACLIAAAFLFGAGVTTKILFIWLAAPIALTALAMLGVRGLWATLRATRLTVWLAAAAALAISLLPLILHNLPSGDTFRFILGNAAQTRIYGHNNLDVLNNLALVASEFMRMMGGDTLHFQAPAGLPLGAAALIAAVLYAAGRSLADRRLIPVSSGSGMAARAARLRLFLLLCVVAVLPLSTISTSGIGATYLFIIVPLAWLLIAVAGCDLAHWLTSRLGARRATFAGSLMTAVFVLSQVATNAQIVQFFATTGGKGLWSDAVHALADELERLAPDHPIIALDWGFARNVNFLTRNRVRLQEAYEFLPAPSPKFQDAASVLLREPANVYVAHAAGNETFRGYRDALERQALRMHKQLELLAAFPERDGTPHTLVYTAADAPRTFTISPSLATRNAIFDDALTLLGGQVNYDPSAREAAVQLHWQSNADRLPDDTVLVHIVDQGTGEVRLVADQQPLYGSYPFSQWQKGEVVDDPRWISLPADLSPGVYQVRIGVYNTETGARRRIRDPQNDAAGDSLMLGTFEVK